MSQLPASDNITGRCAGCGGPVENDYKTGGSRPVMSSDGTLYCSSMCLWRDKYITRRGLAVTPESPTSDAE